MTCPPCGGVFRETVHLGRSVVAAFQATEQIARAARHPVSQRSAVRHRAAGPRADAGHPAHRVQPEFTRRRTSRIPRNGPGSASTSTAACSPAPRIWSDTGYRVALAQCEPPARHDPADDPPRRRVPSPQCSVATSICAPAHDPDVRSCTPTGHQRVDDGATATRHGDNRHHALLSQVGDHARGHRPPRAAGHRRHRRQPARASADVSRRRPVRPSRVSGAECPDGTGTGCRAGRGWSGRRRPTGSGAATGVAAAGSASRRPSRYAAAARS